MFNAKDFLAGLMGKAKARLQEHKARKEEEKRIYQEAYRRAYILALKRKAREDARKKALQRKGFGELVANFLLAHKSAQKGTWRNPTGWDLLGDRNPPNLLNYKSNLDFSIRPARRKRSKRVV